MAVRSVGVVRALHFGDLICAVPALRALKRHNGDSQLTLIGLPWAREFADRFSAYIDGFLEFPGWPGIPERAPDEDRRQQFGEEARARAFDLVVQMHGDGTRVNEFLDSVPAGRRSGFAPLDAARDGFLPYPSNGSEVSRLLALARFLGAEDLDCRLEFPVTQPERVEAARVLRAHGGEPGRPYVCLHAGGRGVDRRWPPGRFAAVADDLQRAGLPVVLSGTEIDRAVNAEVQARMTTRALDLTGATSTGTLAALIQHATLVVTNDSGPSHLAAALRVPSVVLFSGSDRERWAPADDRLHRAVGTGRPDGSSGPPDCPPVAAVLVAIREPMAERSAQPRPGIGQPRGASA